MKEKQVLKLPLVPSTQWRRGKISSLEGSASRFRQARVNAGGKERSKVVIIPASWGLNWGNTSCLVWLREEEQELPLVGLLGAASAVWVGKSALTQACPREIELFLSVACLGILSVTKSSQAFRGWTDQAQKLPIIKKYCKSKTFSSFHFIKPKDQCVRPFRKQAGRTFEA